MKSAIRVTRLRFAHDGAEVPRGISFDVHPGEVFAGVVALGNRLSPDAIDPSGFYDN